MIIVDDIVLGSYDSLHSTGFFCTVHVYESLQPHHVSSCHHYQLLHILYTALIEFLIV